jgi:hypothetical protein
VVAVVSQQRRPQTPLREPDLVSRRNSLLRNDFDCWITISFRPTRVSDFAAPSLNRNPGIPKFNRTHCGSRRRMPSESLHDNPSPSPAVDSTEKPNGAEDSGDAGSGAELPVELSEFSQRLASFGLGEAPDPLLTESRPPSKRRPSR